jgi:hypothetical protein
MGIYRGHEAMNEDTDYVHNAIVNYEPTYIALGEAVTAWQADQDGPIGPYRDQLRDDVEQHREAMGLDAGDLTDDVDYAAIIQFEAL